LINTHINITSQKFSSTPFHLLFIILYSSPLCGSTSVLPVIYYFDTPALGISHQSFDRVKYWLRALNGWDTTGRPQVIGRSVGESVHPIFIKSTKQSCLHPQIRIEIWVGRRIVPVSLPQPAIICLMKIKKEIIIFNSRK
jgi:hypothetical protein